MNEEIENTIKSALLNMPLISTDAANEQNNTTWDTWQAMVNSGYWHIYIQQ